MVFQKCDFSIKLKEQIKELLGAKKTVYVSINEKSAQIAGSNATYDGGTDLFSNQEINVAFRSAFNRY